MFDGNPLEASLSKNTNFRFVFVWFVKKQKGATVWRESG